MVDNLYCGAATATLFHEGRLQRALQLALIGMAPEDITSHLFNESEGQMPIEPETVRAFIGESVLAHPVIQEMAEAVALRSEEDEDEEEEEIETSDGKSLTKYILDAPARLILGSDRLTLIVRMALLGMEAHEISSALHKETGEFYTGMEIQFFLDTHVPANATYQHVHYEVLGTQDDPRGYIERIDHLLNVQERRTEIAIHRESTRGEPGDVERSQAEIELSLKLLRERNRMDATAHKLGKFGQGRLSTTATADQERKPPAPAGRVKKILHFIEAALYSARHETDRPEV